MEIQAFIAGNIIARRTLSKSHIHVLRILIQRYQLSHLSSFPPAAPPPPPFFIAAVPIAPPDFFSSPVSPNESQKSFLSGSTDLDDDDAPPVPVSSTKLLNLSAATFVPDCIPLAAIAAVCWACLAISASAICSEVSQRPLITEPARAFAPPTSGDGAEIHTFAAVGWIQPSLTFLACLPTAPANQPNPFVSAAIGSF